MRRPPVRAEGAVLSLRNLLVAVALALCAFGLQWLDYRYTARVFVTEVYVLLVAGAFTLLGIWLGARLTRGRAGPGASVFEPNTRAIESLGLSDKECEVLKLLAQGLSNREIGERLFIAPSTVKTHLLHLYQKLEVSRRTQAVHKARDLGIVA